MFSESTLKTNKMREGKDYVRVHMRITIHKQ